MKKIYRFLSEYPSGKSLLWLCLLLQALFALVSLSTPEVLRLGTNAVEARSADGLVKTGVLAAVATIVYLSLDAALSILQCKLQNRLEQSVQQRMIRKMISLKKICLQDQKAGALITGIINNATQAVGDSLYTLIGAVEGGITILLGIAYMGYVEWRLMLCVLAYNILLRIGGSYVEKRLKENRKEVISVTKTNNAFLINLLSNMLTLRVFRRGSHFNRLLQERERQTLRTSWKAFVWSNGCRPDRGRQRTPGG